MHAKTHATQKLDFLRGCHKMSTIHNALNRAQKEKDATSRSPYPGIGSGSGLHGFQTKKRVVWFCAGVVFLALAGYLWLMLAREPVQDPASEKQAKQAVLPELKEPAKPVLLLPSGKKIANNERPPKGVLVAQAKVQNKSGPDEKAGPPVFNADSEKPSRQNAWSMARERRLAKKVAEKSAVAARTALLEKSEKPKDSPKIRKESGNGVPQAPDAARWYAKGVISQVKGRLGEAKKYYGWSLDADPAHAPSLNNLAVLEMDQKRYEAARAGFEKAIAADIKYVDPWYNLACLYARQGLVDEAMVHIKTAASMDASVCQWAAQDKDLASLRGHDEFDELMTAP